jgi:hypothetical protein
MSEVLWKILVIGFFLFFAATGVRMMLNPDRFVRRSGTPKGGEMLKTWNRDQMRVTGAILVVFTLYVVYHVLAD